MSISSNPLQGLHFGIELEYEGYQFAGKAVRAERDGHLRHWNVDEDGSLRGGVELISVPLSPASTHLALAEVQAVMDEAPPECTERCSTHVHVNVSDLTVDQFKSFMYLSLCLEPVLMKFCNRFRQSSNFCLPTYNSVNLVDSYRTAIKMAEDGRLSYLDSPKYAATGLYRLRDLGTVEFRMFESYPNTDKIKTVLELLSQIYQLALSRNVEQLKDAKLMQGVQSLLTPLLSEVYQSFIPQDQLETTMEKGIRMANDMVRPVKTAQDMLAIHKELFPESAAYNRPAMPQGVELSQEELEYFLARKERQPIDGLAWKPEGYIKADLFTKYVRYVMATDGKTDQEAMDYVWAVLSGEAV